MQGMAIGEREGLKRLNTMERRKCFSTQLVIGELGRGFAHASVSSTTEIPGAPLALSLVHSGHSIGWEERAPRAGTRAIHGCARVRRGEVKWKEGSCLLAPQLQNIKRVGSTLHTSLGLFLFRCPPCSLKSLSPEFLSPAPSAALLTLHVYCNNALLPCTTHVSASSSLPVFFVTKFLLFSHPNVFQPLPCLPQRPVLE